MHPSIGYSARAYILCKRFLRGYRSGRVRRAVKTTRQTSKHNSRDETSSGHNGVKPIAVGTSSTKRDGTKETLRLGDSRPGKLRQSLLHAGVCFTSSKYNDTQAHRPSGLARSATQSHSFQQQTLRRIYFSGSHWQGVTS